MRSFLLLNLLGCFVLILLTACDSPGLVRRGDPQTVLDALGPGAQQRPPQSAMNPPPQPSPPSE